MDPITTFLLQDCFWGPVDSGTLAQQTALLTGIFDGVPLAEFLCHRFGISVEKAQFEIIAARLEVEL